MLLKNSRGSVLEDIDQYDVLTRIKANMKTKCRLQSEAEGSKKLQNGSSIIIFPEGTRARPRKGLKSFSKSYGILAAKNNVPIIPICHNSGLYWRNRRFKCGRSFLK